MQPLSFRHSEPFTIGVELELQLLDAQTLDLSPRAPALLAMVPSRLAERIKPEFIQSMVEISTPVCQDIQQVEHELSALCQEVASLAAELGCVTHAASLHPFARARDRLLSPGARYSEILDELQLAGRRMMTQALHVHVGLPDPATAVRVCDAIRPCLPILLALSASSPFFEGEDTGFSSYRTNLFKALPRSGIPETLGGWPRFQLLLRLLSEATVLNSIKELWWDARPHPQFGTVEIRICDLPSRLEDILALAALIQGLVFTLARQPEPADEPFFREIVLGNKWHAARYGLDGTFISHEPGRHRPLAQAALELLDRVRPAARALGSARRLEAVRRIVRHGNSALRQREIFRRHRDFTAVIAELRKEFWQ